MIFDRDLFRNRAVLQVTKVQLTFRRSYGLVLKRALQLLGVVIITEKSFVLY